MDIEISLDAQLSQNMGSITNKILLRFALLKRPDQTGTALFRMDWVKLHDKPSGCIV